MPIQKLPRVTEAPDLAGAYVLLRAALNAPVKDGRVTNEFRISRARLTIDYLRQRGARTLVLAHIGREPNETLEPVYRALQQHVPLTFSKFSSGEPVQSARAEMKNGDVLLLENIRQDARETSNDPELGRELAALCDVFVNDAFPDSHRAHASIVGVPPHRPTYFGLNFIHEYDELARALEPQSPALFLLGGAKFETKIPLVEQLIETYDQVFIGGALANDVFRARGWEVGTSLVSDVDLAGRPLLQNDRLLIPIDVTVDGPAGRRVCAPEGVAPNETILDVGPATVQMLAPLIAQANTILWNGPVGNFEEGFGEQTIALARLIAAAPGYSVIGGGDTIAAIEPLQLDDQFDFLSTAGGAMLTFLETGTLPAIDAVLQRQP